jgi:hypothetical protein
MESLKCVRMLRRPNFKLKFSIVYNHYGGTPKSALTTKKLYGLPVVGGVPRNGRSYGTCWMMKAERGRGRGWAEACGLQPRRAALFIPNEASAYACVKPAAL